MNNQASHSKVVNRELFDKLKTLDKRVLHVTVTIEYDSSPVRKPVILVDVGQVEVNKIGTIITYKHRCRWRDNALWDIYRTTNGQAEKLEVSNMDETREVIEQTIREMIGG